jgi:hypothetical protein
MKKSLLTAAVAALLAGGSGAALAVDIGGLEVPTGANFAVGQVYENVVTQVGDVLQGYGKVDSINSFAVGSLCSDCELTYRFSGYTVTSISANEVKFSGGTISFYLGSGAFNNFNTSNAGGSAGDLAEATDGTLFMTLTGHAIDALGNTFIGTGANIGTLFPTGFGTGLADIDLAAGGIANSYFNTNGITAAFGGNADFELGSSFSGLNPPYPGECPGGAACVRGSADFTGNVAAIPEPETYALMLAGLGAVGFVARRRQRS